MKKYFLALVIFSTACATQMHHGELSFGDVPTPRESYSDVLDKWTASERAYNGITADFQVTATLVSTDVLEHHIFRSAEELHWTADQFKEARQKALYGAQSETTFFIALYTEKDENNDLDKTKSSWNVFLDVGGRRVSPKSIQRLHENTILLVDKYPYYTVWSRPYLVRFPIGTAEVMGSPAILTLAGPLGAAHLKFPKGT